MLRQIIKIDKDKCNGCGLCVSACHEGAIGMVDGRAELLRDDYCDGLGNCLPVCPTGAISFEMREAAEFNEEEVKKNMNRTAQQVQHGGCPGSRSLEIERVHEAKGSSEAVAPESELRQWPVQIKLAPPNAPYFNNANLLIAADCTAYSYGDFHRKFMKNKITLIGCPKLDEGDYSEKLTSILRMNNIKSVTVVRMEVPCCGGIVHAVKQALINCGKMIPWHIVTVSTDGQIIEE